MATQAAENTVDWSSARWMYDISDVKPERCSCAADLREVRDDFMPPKNFGGLPQAHNLVYSTHFWLYLYTLGRDKQWQFV